MGAHFDDTTVVEQRDPVGPHGRRQAVGDDDGGSSLQQDIQGVLYL